MNTSSLQEGLEHLTAAVRILSQHSNALVRQAVDDLAEIRNELAETTGEPTYDQLPATPEPRKPPPKTTDCKKCGMKIYFAPHPLNPEKLAPFNVSDGDIHFGSCGGKNEGKREYHSKEELRQAMACKVGKLRSPTCLNQMHVHLATMANGKEFLRVTCGCHGNNIDIIPMTEANMALIDKPKDWHKEVRKIIYPYGNY